MKMYLSAREIAHEVPCQYHRVLKAVQTGELPSQQMAGAYMVNAGDAEEWIKRARVQTDPAYVLELEAENASLKARLERLGGRAA